MPKVPKFKPVRADEGWRVNVPAKVSVSGKRERYFFPTKEMAQAEANRLREKTNVIKIKAAALTGTLAEQAAKAAELLEPYGISILEAASRIAEMEAAKALSVPVETATAAFIKVKDGLSDKQKDAIARACKHLNEDFAKQKLSEITGKQIAEHVANRTNGDTAFNGRLRVLVTLWRWAAHPDRGWCKGDALQHVERAEVTSSEIGVLTAQEVAHLLATAEHHYPETVPAFAIALFTGMRQQEIERLSPEDITEDGISIAAAKSKSKRRRFVQMPEPLKEWIAAYPIGETIVPTNWPRKEKAVRRLAGWRVWTDMVEPAEAPVNLPDWPQNALRHTAASIVLAMGKDLDTLIFEHGHAGGTTLLKSHYIGRMPKKEALKIWSTGPHGLALTTIRSA